MGLVRRALPDVAASALVAVAVFAAFGHAFLNYDTFYALLWGKELIHGQLPQYQVPVAPTPHPLATLVGAVVSPLGDSAEDVLLGIVLLAVGALVVGVYRLGQVSYAWPVGLLAALIVVTRQPILNFGIRGYVDLPTIALIVWAAVLEARRKRRGVPVLVLLALAGLLRPEAWLFAGAYWLWLCPPLDWPRRLKLLAFVVVPPLLWALSDLAVTGDPFFSLTGTSDLASTLKRPTGVGGVVEYLPRRLGEILRLPELIAAVIGCLAGLRWLRTRTLLPLAVAVLNGIAFVLFAIAGLSLLTRYMFLAACMLAIFAALAVFGWTALDPEHRVRRAWRWGGALVLLVILAFSYSQFDRLRDLRTDIAKRDRIQADMLLLVRERAARSVLDRCRPLYVPNHRPVPSLAYWLNRRPKKILSAQLARPAPGGAFLYPATEEVKRLGVLDKNDPKRLDARVPPGYTVRARNRSWLLYAGCR